MPVDPPKFLEQFKLAKMGLRQRFFPKALKAGAVGRHPSLSVRAAMAGAASNVHAIGIGQKLTAGTLTDVHCVRLYVSQKLPRALVPPNDMLPAAIDGIPTDVIESPPAFVLPPISPPPQDVLQPGGRVAIDSSHPPCTVNRRSRQRPVMPGISAAHYTVTAGTISAFCRSVHPEDKDNSKSVFVLSNNHVFADVNQGSRGDDLCQPGPMDGGTSADVFAKLRRFVPIQLGGTAANHVDAAIGELLEGVAYAPGICSIGPLTGTTRAAENQIVRKHGRTTGYTEGRVTDVAYDALVGMDHNDPGIVALFEDQIRIERIEPFDWFGLGGDSGSLVVTKEAAAAVGLYFAGPENGFYGVANPIEDVLRELRITLL